MWPFKNRDLKNKVFFVFMEFGPKLAIDRKERLAGEFPSLKEAELTDIISEFQTVEKRLWDFAKNLDKEPVIENDLKELITQEFQFMDRKSVDFCINRVHDYKYRL